MNIAIDARWIFREISGIGNYTRQLIQELVRIDARNRYTILFDDIGVARRTVRETEMENAPNFTAVRFGCGVFSPLSQCLLPSFLRRHKIAVYHTPNYMLPLAAFPPHRQGRTACVTTIHDVIPLVFPDHAPRSRKTRLLPLFRRLMQEVGRRSDAIVTVSNTSRDDIIRTLHLDPPGDRKVHVIHNGVSSQFRPLPEKPADAPTRTILYVGRADPYKNLCTLVSAMEIVTNTSPTPVQLVIAGSPDPRYPEPQAVARRLGVESHITWTGYLPDDRLVQRYQAADILVHPSRYEGFGLQVLEAMACGTPVICSNGGALPEVAGDAAILVDPNSVTGLADQILRVLDNPALALDLRRKGLERVKAFSWRATAQQTLAVYQRYDLS
jgi:glycosyltransferase involved in cell wall biosynthesis